MASKQTVLYFTSTKSSAIRKYVNELSNAFSKTLVEVDAHEILSPKKSENMPLDVLLKEYDPVMIVFEYATRSRKEIKNIKRFLSAFRELRVPYIGVSGDLEFVSAPKKIIVPVGFLPEEKEKAPWSNSFIKFCNSDVALLKPKDRGTRAQRNVEFIKKFIEGQNNRCSLIDGAKNSFKIEFEALNSYAKSFDMIMISASRAYGLDDVFLGPKEFHVLKKATLPIMLINPRDDIYVLCGD